MENTAVESEMTDDLSCGGLASASHDIAIETGATVHAAQCPAGEALLCTAVADDVDSPEASGVVMKDVKDSIEERYSIPEHLDAAMAQPGLDANGVGAALPEATGNSTAALESIESTMGSGLFPVEKIANGGAHVAVDNCIDGLGDETRVDEWAVRSTGEEPASSVAGNDIKRAMAQTGPVCAAPINSIEACESAQAKDNAEQVQRGDVQSATQGGLTQSSVAGADNDIEIRNDGTGHGTADNQLGARPQSAKGACKAAHSDDIMTSTAVVPLRHGQCSEAQRCAVDTHTQGEADAIEAPSPRFAGRDWQRVTQPSNFLANQMTTKSSGGFGALFESQQMDMELLRRHFEELFDQDLEVQLAAETAEGYHQQTKFGFMDVSTFVRGAMESIVQDSFSICFECMPREHWDWNFYLWPAYWLGVVLRYVILFPLRLLCLMCGIVMYFAMYGLSFLRANQEARQAMQLKGLWLLSFMWIGSWSGVIQYHGTPPPRRVNQVYVSNHTTVLDIMVLLQRVVVCLVGQKQPSVIGFLQDYVLSCMNNLWFDRKDKDDRLGMSARIQKHIQDPATPPLLLFPEGVCVNNEYSVMFKRGAFALDAEVVPVAIKYNRLFCDAFWNSKLHSFSRHCYRLMTSWCVVADVWFLEPQRRREGESPIDFAARVKQMICQRAGLVSVPWDGYLKYFRPSAREKCARQRVYASVLCRRFGLSLADKGAKAA